MEWLRAVGLQCRPQMDESGIHSSCLDQKYAQMVIGSGMAGVGFDERTIGLLRDREASCAVVGKRFL